MTWMIILYFRLFPSDNSFAVILLYENRLYVDYFLVPVKWTIRCHWWSCSKNVKSRYSVFRLITLHLTILVHVYIYVISVKVCPGYRYRHRLFKGSATPFLEYLPKWFDFLSNNYEIIWDKFGKCFLISTTCIILKEWN